MNVERRGGTVDIAVSGLRVQAQRMTAIASNIANASTSRTSTGEVYRRKDVQVTSTGGGLGGVMVARVVQGKAGDSKEVLMPGHPDANDRGYVKMPNIELPTEMMDMVTASRAYQANVAVMKRCQDLTDATLELLR
jgi:flagellar basal-body rod protein FlgC